MVKSTAKPRADEDSPWKLVLRKYCREAIEFFFPDVAKVIDWTHPIEFLDTEFQKITPDAEIGRRFADQLVKVRRLVSRLDLLEDRSCHRMVRQVIGLSICLGGD
ncbi:MAG: hypothetical protein HC860_13795 [Alkalinema sp. RU_4_3]|nr:hypothetical protein [Alkalinema sp. RU_4_3]